MPDHLRTINLEGGNAFAKNAHNLSGKEQEITTSVDRAYGGFFGDKVESKPLFKKKADRHSQKNRLVYDNFDKRKNGSYHKMDFAPASKLDTSDRASQNGQSLRSSDQVNMQSGYFNVRAKSGLESLYVESRTSGSRTSEGFRRTGKKIKVHRLASYGGPSIGESSSQKQIDEMRRSSTAE